MDNVTIKVGVIGCGTIAVMRHLPEYAARSDVEIAAVYNRTPAKAEEVQRQYGGIVCKSVEELVAMDLDAVSVCSVNAEHTRDSILALRAGKHVLCEKPMGITMEDCEAMTEEAEKAGKLLMIAHNQRFSEQHVNAHELIASGGIGRVLSFDAGFGHAGPEVWTGDKDTWFFHRQAAGMGVLADLAVHKIDLIHYLTGEPVAEIYARTATLDKRYPDGRPIDVEDNAWCLCRTESGISGTLRVSWTNYGDMFDYIVIYGSKGTVSCYDAWKDSPVTGVIDEFVDCIKTGRPCRSTGREALKSMRAVFAALESSQTGTVIKIPENVK